MYFGQQRSQEQQIRPALLDHAQRLTPRLRAPDDIASLAQRLLEQSTTLWLVIDNQHAQHFGAIHAGGRRNDAGLLQQIVERLLYGREHVALLCQVLGELGGSPPQRRRQRRQPRWIGRHG